MRARASGGACGTGIGNGWLLHRRNLAEPLGQISQFFLTVIVDDKSPAWPCVGAIYQRHRVSGSIVHIYGCEVMQDFYHRQYKVPDLVLQFSAVIHPARGMHIKDTIPQMLDLCVCGLPVLGLD